jgi:hypothetical protein
MKALLAWVFRRAAWALSSSVTAFEEEGDVVDRSLIFIADLEMPQAFSVRLTSNQNIQNNRAFNFLIGCYINLKINRKKRALDRC